VFRDRPQVFLAFSSTDKNSSKLVDVIKNALSKSGVDSVSPEDLSTAGGLGDLIDKAVRAADGLVADVTGTTPWVMLEVGLAVGLRKPVLLLTREPTKMPSDLRRYQVAVYKPEDLGTVGRYVEFWLRDAVMPKTGDAST